MALLPVARLVASASEVPLHGAELAVEVLPQPPVLVDVGRALAERIDLRARQATGAERQREVRQGGIRAGAGPAPHRAGREPAPRRRAHAGQRQPAAGERLAFEVPRPPAVPRQAPAPAVPGAPLGVKLVGRQDAAVRQSVEEGQGPDARWSLRGRKEACWLPGYASPDPGARSRRAERAGSPWVLRPVRAGAIPLRH